MISTSHSSTFSTHHAPAFGRYSWATVLLCSGLLLFTGCHAAVQGTGPIETEVRAVPAFAEVELRVPAEVEIRTGETASVQLETHANLFSRITTEVVGDRLRIEADTKLETSKPIKIVIVTPSLEGVSISGAGTITSEVPLSGKAATVAISGSGRMTLLVDADALETRISGAGNITLSGTAETLDLQISGSGRVDASKLETREADFRISGSGRVETHVEDRLKVRISGAGKVEYTGDPQLEVKTSGAGKVRKVGEA